MGKKLMIIFLIMTIVLGLGVLYFLQQPQFGKLPTGEYLRKMQSSPHYKNGQFQNSLPTTVLIDDSNFISSLVKFILTEKERSVPRQPIPSVKINLFTLDKEKNIVIWLGHSSYFSQIEGKRILIDPVLSPYASPLPFINKAFPGTTPYTPEDIPDIDYVLISHDHWDHLDYPTMIALKKKANTIICPLGIGGYFLQWGFKQEQVREGDWFDVVNLDQGVAVHILPARHFSGRLLERNKTLWSSFAIISPKFRAYYSGDGGYGPHFKEIGNQLGPFDLTIMENGQYGLHWPYIHMVPEETAQAAVDLQAKAMLPGHAAKFALANHAWDDPYERIVNASKNKPYHLLTPILGQVLEFEQIDQAFSHWWETIN